MSTTAIIAAAEQLARVLLKKPLKNFGEYTVDVKTVTNCSTIASSNGFTLRIDRNPSAGTIVARVYHAAAHMLCQSYGVSSHSGSNRHTRVFDQALEALGAPASALEEEFLAKLTKTQRAALDEFMGELAMYQTKRRTGRNVGAARVTLSCPLKACSHTITVRESAASKTRFICVEHDREMKPKTKKG